ncbi:MAG: hypothetical protein LQ339_001156 [Xanthoria mediterranea]|nr:MAG: hypothetical protein LQ339_001156 [Xanthoria mediterranea]
MHIDSIKTAEISLTSTNAKKFLSYGDEAREPGKFSKQRIMAEQFAILQNRASTRNEKHARGPVMYDLQQHHELGARILPLEDFHDASAQPELKRSMEIIIHGYKKAVNALPNTDPETQEDLRAFRNSVRFPTSKPEKLVNYTFAHCVSRQFLQLHHPDNELT